MTFTTLALVLFLLFGFVQVTGDVYSLYYLYNIRSKNSDSNIYDWTAVTLLDDRQIDFYNSANESRTSNPDWLKNIPQSDWKTHTEKLQSDGQWLNKLLDVQMIEFGHAESDGHILQWRHGCVGTRRSDGSVFVLSRTNEFAYDGEDLIQFICETWTWLTPEKKKNREREKNWNNNNLYRFTAVGKCDQCEKMLNMYLQYRTADITASHSPPAVHIFEKKSVHDSSKLTLTCLVTGFYPKDVEMSLRKSGTEIPEPLVNSSGVRPNGDGTYQLRMSVEIPEHDSADYYCYVSHSSLENPMIKKWERTGGGNIEALLVSVAVLILGAVIFCVVRRRIRRRQPNPDDVVYSDEKVPGVLPPTSCGILVAHPGPGVKLPSYEDASSDASSPPSYEDLSTDLTGGGGPGFSRPPSYKETCTDDEDDNEAVNDEPAASQPEDSSS